MLVSGVFNAVVLAAWRLNYFQIAATSDVVVTGFMVFFILFLILGGPAPLLIRGLDRWRRGEEASPDADPAAPDSGADRCQDGRVLWMGEVSVLMRCAPGRYRLAPPTAVTPRTRAPL